MLSLDRGGLHGESHRIRIDQCGEGRPQSTPLTYDSTISPAYYASHYLETPNFYAFLLYT